MKKSLEVKVVDFWLISDLKTNNLKIGVKLQTYLSGQYLNHLKIIEL